MTVAELIKILSTTSQTAEITFVDDNCGYDLKYVDYNAKQNYLTLGLTDPPYILDGPIYRA